MEAPWIESEDITERGPTEEIEPERKRLQRDGPQSATAARHAGIHSTELQSTDVHGLICGRRGLLSRVSQVRCLPKTIPESLATSGFYQLGCDSPFVRGLSARGCDSARIDARQRGPVALVSNGFPRRTLRASEPLYQLPKLSTWVRLRSPAPLPCPRAAGVVTSVPLQINGEYLDPTVVVQYAGGGAVSRRMVNPNRYQAAKNTIDRPVELGRGFGLPVQPTPAVAKTGIDRPGKRSKNNADGNRQDHELGKVVERRANSNARYAREHRHNEVTLHSYRADMLAGGYPITDAVR